ncbi:MAG: hypothetical protein C5B50_09115 [Verrucomicrobia bacterium]|nr:MAG: hypothetical protein C5B50_09115 [Verrucomicrobiota bacterium]
MVFQKRRRLKLAALATFVVLLFLLGLAYFLWKEPEPGFQGRSLSEWHRIWLDSVDLRHPSLARQQAAEAAIRQIGTNAIPLCLDQFRRQARGSYQVIAVLANWLPERVATGETLYSLANHGHTFHASSVFYILGSRASPALPQLTEMMYSTNPALARDSVWCLGYLGKDGLPPLIAALDRPDLPCCPQAERRLGTEEVIQRSGTNLAVAVPGLVKLAMSKDSELCAKAVTALCQVSLEPQVCIPALEYNLSSYDRKVRFAAVMALLRFRATNSLASALSNTNENVHRWARYSLDSLLSGTNIYGSSVPAAWWVTNGAFFSKTDSAVAPTRNP